MGRPRTHDRHTADTLLETAERIVEIEGLDGLTVRRVADAGGTTTRAVYSLFASKDGLLVALGRRAFDLLRSQIGAMPTTDRPEADLVEAGVSVFRRFVIDHPALFRIGVQRAFVEPELWAEFRGAASDALAGLELLVERLQSEALLGGRTTRDATRAFHALCEGLAAMELRGALPDGQAERIWRDALTTLVRGFGVPPG